MHPSHDILAELLASYATHAWPFMLAHIGILMLVVGSWRNMHREALALEGWHPGRGRSDSNNGTNSVTGILDDFVEEAERLGRQGFFVPISDCSDRLDSIVTGLLVEVNERINLFVIVGIAGSLYGVFEFAFRATDVLGGSDPGGERIVMLGAALSESLAKAFPVGFMGLLLMFVTQIAASPRERKLRAAVASATGRAVRERASSSQSQAQVLEQAAQDIREALQPIVSLRALLAETLEPVVRELGERLDRSLDVIKAQSAELHRAAAGFSGSVTALVDSTHSLRQTSQNLEALLQAAPEILAEVRKTQIRQAGILDTFEAGLQNALRTLTELLPAIEAAAQGVRHLPASIGEATREALGRAGREASTAWSQAAEQVASSHRRSLDDLAVQAATLAQNIDSANTALTAAGEALAAHFQGLANEASASLAEVRQASREALDDFRGIGSDARETMSQEFGTLRLDATRSWDQMVGQFGGGLQQETLGYIGRLSEAARHLRTSIDEVSAQVQRALETNQAQLDTQLRGIMTDIRNDVTTTLRALDDLLAKHTPEATHQVVAFTSGLRELLSDVASSQDQLEQWGKSLGTGRAAFDEATERLLARQPSLEDAAFRADVLRVLQQIRDEVAASARPRGRPLGSGSSGSPPEGGWWRGLTAFLTRPRRMS